MTPEPSIIPTPKTSSPRRSLDFGTFLFVIVIFLIGFAVGHFEAERQTASSTEVLHPSNTIFTNKESKEKIDFALFWKVWDLLQQKYVGRGDLDANTLFYGAIKGMLEASGDPYTTFFSPEEQKAFEEDISGIFEGIGAEMGLRDGVVTVVAPLEGMPAEAAGIRAGDRILKINGESTESLTLDQAVEKIRGPKGTEVTLSVYSEGDENTHEVTLKRSTILVKSVRYENKGDGIALVRVSRFGDDTHREFAKAAESARADQARGIILDLRNNPGGLLDGAVDLSGYFLPTGTLVVQEEDAQGSKTQLRTEGSAILENIPVVILINQGSASAAEILAGAIRENRENVRIVGETSFGKGSVQELIPVSKDTSVKITVARWLTPKGNQINQKGIDPDTKVELSRDDFLNKKDPQYDKALEVLKELLK